MKKRVFFILICTIFSLGGCGQKNAKETVLNTYKEWKQMQLDIFLVGLSWDTSETYLFGEGHYSKVKDDRFQTMEDIKEAVEEICTESFAESEYYKPYFMRESPMYLERDGVLYRLQSDLVLPYGSVPTDFKIIKREKEYIHARMEFNDDYLEETQTIDIEIVLEDEKWLVNSLEDI